MLKENFRFFRQFYLFLDAGWIVVAWIASYWLRFHSGWIPVFFSVPPFKQYLFHLPLVLLVWMGALVYGGTYNTERWWNFSGEWKAMFKISVMAMVVLVAITYLSVKIDFSRIGYLCFWFLALSGLLSYRHVLRGIYSKIHNKGVNLKYVLVVGENGFTPSFHVNLQHHPEIGLKIYGQLHEIEEPAAGVASLQVLGGYSELREIVRRGEVDIVVFTLPLEHTWQLKSLLEAIEDFSVDIQVIPDVFSITPLHPGIEDFEGIPMIHVRAGPQQGIASLRKRMLDTVLSLAAMGLLLPFFILIAVLIKATSPGPVFYRQSRLGLNGKEFSMLKLRTMAVDAEKDSGPVWSQKQDPRKTRLGAFLRRYSLDEIPQLWNVLKGEMSLVGPRPERPEFIQEFQKNIPLYILRHKVKTGLTGLAQIKGWRGPTSLEKRIEYDIKYIERWSLGLDLKILFLTLWKGFINRAEQ